MNDGFIEQPTRGFWIIGAAALVWNLLGVAAYLTQVNMSPEAYAALAPEVRALSDATPVWATAAYAVAVFVGTLACIALLLKKSWAVALFAISLLAVFVQFGYSLLLADTIAVLGIQVIIMPLCIIGIGIFLLLFARNATRRGILR